MAAVYILFSKKLNRFYTGSCREHSSRLNQHVDKVYTNSFTSKADDWKLFIVIEDLKYKQARAIEDHIKKMKSKNFIINLKKYPELVQRLVARFS
jgi:putative endonuclease